MQIIYVPWPPVSFLSCLSVLFCNTGIGNFFLKGQIVNILGFVGLMVSVATTQPCLCNAETSVNDT